MKLLIVLVTYNREAYTRQTLRSLWKNTSDDADYYLIVVDNASTDGTPQYIERLYGRLRINSYLLNKENYYPGKACNMGWELGLKKYDATHLMRLDNDMQFEKDWDLRVAEYFEAIPELGQLGIDHEAIEHSRAPLYKRVINGMGINEWPGCVGGPSIIRKKLWDSGIRWPEMRWDDGRRSAAQEDSAFSKIISNRGYLVGHTQEELGRTFAHKENWKDYKDYYMKTISERGYEDDLNYLKGLA